jgi:hypothetical protein
MLKSPKKPAKNIRLIEVLSIISLFTRGYEKGAETAGVKIFDIRPFLAA